jgi:glucose/arabinose dehydrogenase
MHRSGHRLVMVALALAAATAAASAATVAVETPLAFAAPPPHLAVVPFGFTDVAAASVPQPTAVHALPGGTVAVLGKAGTLWLLRGGQRLASPSLSLPVCTESERGLLGIAPDPAFLTNGWIYLYRTLSVNGTCVNRVSRFTLTGDVVDPASELVLLDRIPSPGGNHNGGDLEVGADGFLYVSVGDGGVDPRGNSGSAGSNDAARDMSLLNGKILRLDRATGAPAPGNPYSGAGTVACKDLLPLPPTTVVCQEIFASGLRNPWRIAFDPNAAGTRFFINDVGQGAREEVDEGIAGADYGWNVREGQCPRGQNPPCAGPAAGMTDPVTDYGRTYGSYVTGGAFVPNGSWPAQFDGGYLFGDGGTGRIWLRRADGTVDYDAPFATVAGLSDLAFADESFGLSLYYVNAGATTDSVRRITFPRQTVPTASAPLALHPLASALRVFDSRLAADGAAPLVGNQARTIATGVDGTTSAAVLVNLTYVSPVTPGFLTAWASGVGQPATSNVNALAGEVVANAAVVPVDAQGRIQVLTNTDAHVVVDLLGTFDTVITGTNTTGVVRGGRLVPLEPARLADTRDPAGGDNLYTDLGGSPIGVVRVPVAGRHGVPTSGVGSVALTVTAVAGSQDLGGYVTVAPSGASRPPTSNVNTNRAGDIRPNLVIVPLGADGAVDVHLFRTDDVVLDVIGWFTDDSATAGTAGRFRSVSPYREVDTRTPFGFDPFRGDDTRVLDPVAVPASAIGVAQNITVVGNAGAGFVTSYPAEPRPLASTANASGADQLRAASSFTRLGSGGAVRYYAMMPTDLVVDVTGWFEGTPG